MIKDYLNLAARNIRHRKLRSWLTVIGVIIGISSIVALLLLSEGLENAIIEQFEDAGANRIFVLPGTIIGGSFADSLTKKDLETVEKVSGIKWAHAYITRAEEIEFGNEKDLVPSGFFFSLPTNSLEEHVRDSNFFDLQEGRIFKSGERSAMIIGDNIAHDVFRKDIKINSNVKVKDKKFRVIGVFKMRGTQDDNNVLIPEDDMKELFDVDDDVSFIEARVADGIDVNEVGKKIETELERERGDEDFQVSTPESFLETLGNILGIVQVVLGGIAAISLLVGGIGIANSMFTSVLERTRDIGIMKSVGARNSSILYLFLLESSLISSIGGIIGVLFGILIAKVVEKLAASAGFGLLLIIINPSIIFFGVIFAAFVGAISGFIPAYRASKLRPVEALGR